MIRELLIPKKGGGAMQWVANSAIRSGLPTTSPHYCTACVYERDGTRYFLSGKGDAYGMDAWSWNGSSWVSNNGEVNYMSTGHRSSYPDVWYEGASLYCIFGDSGGNFSGYIYSYGWWDYSTVEAGLFDIGIYAQPCIIKIGTDTYMLATEGGYQINGYKWNGAGWSSNTPITTGISIPNQKTGLGYFELNGEVYLAQGLSSSGWLGYKWNGSGWDSDDSCVAGLPGLPGAAPDIFTVGSDIYMLSGTYRQGFKGFKLQV